MLNTIEAQVKDRVSTFVTELDKLVRQSVLEALRGVLEGGSAPARRGRPAGSGRGPGRPKGRRSSVDTGEASAKIVAFVQSNDGQGISAISSGTGIDLKTAKKCALKLLADGTLAKSGQKRGTVYHVGSGKPARSAKKAKRAKRGRKSKAA